MHQNVQHPRIVFVSDNVIRRELIAKLLTTRGFLVDIYPEGMAALDSIADPTPSTADPKPWLVILDGSIEAILGAQLMEKINRLVGKKIQYIVLNSAAVHLPDPGTTSKQKEAIAEYINLQAATTVVLLAQLFWKQRNTKP